MHGKKKLKLSPGAHNAARKKELQHEKAWKKARAAWGRPKAADKGSFVFIGVKGGRLSNVSDRKGYMAYITRTGKVRPVKSSKATGAPVPRKVLSYNVARAPGRKRAVETFYKARLSTFKKGGFSATAKGEKKFGLDTKRVAGRLAGYLRRVVQGMGSRRHAVIEIQATVSGREKAIKFSVDFGKAEKQKISKMGYKRFVEAMILARLGDELDLFNLVTSQSAKNIFMDDGEFTTREGEPWGREDNKRVKLLKFEYEIRKVEIVSPTGKKWTPPKAKK